MMRQNIEKKNMRREILYTEEKNIGKRMIRKKED